MTFTSFSFLIFMAATLVVYYVCPKKFRWIILLLASGTFYGIVCLKYMPFLIFTILTTFFAAIGEEKIQDKRSAELKSHKEDWSSEEKKKYKQTTKIQKRLLLVAPLVLNFGILFVLKGYLQMALPNAGISAFLTSIHILLPLGISFYTFQSMGYLVDVYRGKTKAEHNPAKFALFVSFFPQIIQGPIAIYDDLAKQLYDGHDLEFENIKFGFQLILWGLIKKMVIADRAAPILNEILANKAEYGGFATLFAVLIYALQLYADFSGGIDIARGVAQMLGVTMAENFRRPYFAKSLAEYWRRWHITLGAWLKNYLFYPIAMSNGFFKIGKKAKKVFGSYIGKELPGCIATLITFLVIGIWHGANWKYVGFGIWNGGILFISTLLKPVFLKMNEKLHIREKSFGWRLWQMLRTFLLVLGGYVFDIADGLGDAFSMLKNTTAGAVTDLANGTAKAFLGSFRQMLMNLGMDGKDLVLIITGLIVMIVVSIIQEKSQKSLRGMIDQKTKWLEWVLMVAATMAVIILGVYGPGIKPGEFVYMQF
ncbi:MAG: MBOAT family O-acyltransferase [Lachnospiraceae bacterium]|nr:MBOAT family O-acyltransferase [Lachnospiraceae bacterium]